MKNIGTVSVIIPIYNADQYLIDCIKSIINQSYKNIEIICVNDGSSDTSEEIITNFQKNDSRIIIINQINSGVTKARENGIKKANGQYILFSDADDIMPSNAIELLTEKIDVDVDIVFGSVKFKGSYKWPYKSKKRILSASEYVRLLVTKKIHCGPYARLFNKVLFTENAFNISKDIVCGEDYIMNLNLALNVKGKIIQIENIVYEYIQRPTNHPSDFKNRIKRLKTEIRILSKKYKKIIYLRFFVFVLDEVKNIIRKVIKK